MCLGGSRERAAITDNEQSQVGFSFITQNNDDPENEDLENDDLENNDLNKG